MRAVVSVSITFFLLSSLCTSAQMRAFDSMDTFPAADVNWQNKDFLQDYTVGSSVDKAYKELLKGKKPRQRIIVAVLDGGVDVKHKDLQGKIWVNDKEIAGNGKDDDNNGYIDDVNGWNFLGNSKGKNVLEEVYEPVRVVAELDSSMINYASLEVVPDSLKSQYKLWVTCRKEVMDKRAELKTVLNKLDTLETELAYCERLVARATGKKENTPDEICALQTEDKNIQRAKEFLCGRFSQGFTYEGFRNYKKRVQRNLNETWNPEYKPRKIIGDNPRNINDRYYGNADVKGPRADHGTFVAGIIAANRDNDYGIDGIAESVEIMAVRTTPDGDENDKDVALGIRYAVDNGARVINMSFGKDYSLRKQWVDSALVYAQSKNVLLVHSSGNSSQDLDDVMNYPTNFINDTLSVQSWLNVGAHYRMPDLEFVGEFSNYGKKTVDLFAPGVQIVSLAPDNKFSQADGTSFAAPVVSGIAALVWSYYPQLSALQIKEIINKSAQIRDDLKVNVPSQSEKKEKIKFKRLSKTGGIVNAYAALELAEEMTQAQIKGVMPMPK